MVDLIRFLVLFVAVGVVAGCQRTTPGRAASPAAPSAVVPFTSPMDGVTGAWVGTYAPICVPHCYYGPPRRGRGPSASEPFALVLRKEGNTITGQINLSGWITRTATVSGTIDDLGTMTLTGGDSWPAAASCYEAGSWNLTSWRARFDPHSRTITGDFGFFTQIAYNACLGPQSLDVTGTDMSMRPVPQAPTSSVAGHWQGTYVIRSCVRSGAGRCHQLSDGTEFPVDLDLDQTPSGVTGVIVGLLDSRPLEVTGSFNGAAFNLAGSRTSPTSGGSSSLRLTSWSTTVDAVGRMQGGLGYMSEYVTSSMVSSESYEAELKYLVRVPWGRN